MTLVGKELCALTISENVQKMKPVLFCTGFIFCIFYGILKPLTAFSVQLTSQHVANLSYVSELDLGRSAVSL